MHTHTHARTYTERERERESEREREWERETDRQTDRQTDREDYAWSLPKHTERETLQRTEPAKKQRPRECLKPLPSLLCVHSLLLESTGSQYTIERVRRACPSGCISTSRTPYTFHKRKDADCVIMVASTIQKEQSYRNPLSNLVLNICGMSASIVWPLYHGEDAHVILS